MLRSVCRIGSGRRVSAPGRMRVAAGRIGTADGAPRSRSLHQVSRLGCHCAGPWHGPARARAQAGQARPVPDGPGVSNSDDSVQPRPGVSDSDDSDVLGSRPGSAVRGALGRPDPDRATQMFRREATDQEVISYLKMFLRPSA